MAVYIIAYTLILIAITSSLFTYKYNCTHYQRQKNGAFVKTEARIEFENKLFFRKVATCKLQIVKEVGIRYLYVSKKKNAKLLKQSIAY